MSTAFNFNEVEDSVKGGNNYERKTVDPGVDVFTVEEGEVKLNTNGKEFLSFKFVNADGKYFKEQFYTTTPNALKRIKELATNSGVKLGEDTAEQVVAKLIGTKVGLVVGGEKELATIEGKEVAVTRARIKNAYNFSFPAAKLEEWKNAKITIEDKTVSAVPTDLGVPAANDDLPF